jgi:hypothetical protein
MQFFEPASGLARSAAAYRDGVVMSRSAVVAGVAAVVATVLALCVPGTALALPGPHRADGHYVYTCVAVRDRAKADAGKICINAFMNPQDQEWHFGIGAAGTV